MAITEQEYSKSSFDKVADRYDQIKLFKISAQFVTSLIKQHPMEGAINILDVACGTGNVVLECARELPEAHFDAIDISEGMLTKAQQNAQALQLSNINFHLQDATQLTLRNKYQIITCSYALFFLPDAHRVLNSLQQQASDNSLIIFTSFNKQAFTPVNRIILSLLKEYGSQTARDYQADDWKNLQTLEDIQKLCKLAQLPAPEVIEKPIRYFLTIDEWWDLLNNTGYKGMLMELNEPNYLAVKTAFHQQMSQYANQQNQVELIADSFFTIIRL